MFKEYKYCNILKTTINKKIPIIKEKAPENLIIQVDGGINNLTAKICTSLGATSLVAGSYIYGAIDYKKNYNNQTTTKRKSRNIIKNVKRRNCQNI